MGWVLLGLLIFTFVAGAITFSVVLGQERAAERKAANAETLPTEAGPATQRSPKVVTSSPLPNSGANPLGRSAPPPMPSPQSAVKAPATKANIAQRSIGVSPITAVNVPAPLPLIPISASSASRPPEVTRPAPAPASSTPPPIVSRLAALPVSPVREMPRQTPKVDDESQMPPEAELTYAAESGVSGLWWIPSGRAITIALGRSTLQLQNPMIYVWDGPLMEPPEPAAVSLKMQVDDRLYQPTSDRELGYWPKYRELTPGQRRYYLDWLATGRRDIPRELGYTFLFIYNLERRALLDRKDQAKVAAEIIRLRECYQRHAELTGDRISRSFEVYTGNFLRFLIACFPHAFKLEEVQAVAAQGGEPTSEDLEVPLGWLAETGHPVPAQVAFALASGLPLSQRGAVVRRLKDELQRLFESRYTQRFQSGLILKSPKRRRKITYRPASAALSVQEADIPSVLSAPKQFEVLSDLWNECVAELRKLSTVVGKQGTLTVTAEAWQAMPAELREGMDHPWAESFAKLHQSKGGAVVAMLSAAELVQVASGGSTENLPVEKVSASRAKDVAQIAQHCGFSVEPDPRLTGTGWAVSEVVALYPSLSEPETTGSQMVDAARYQATACMLSVGMAIAGTDGELHEDETSELSRQLRQSFSLRPQEYRRLEARRQLLATVGADLATAVKGIKKLAPAIRTAIGQMTLALVVADGVVTAEELASTRRVYRAIGLEPGDADAAIRRLMEPASSLPPAPSSEEEPVVMVAAGPVAVGEPIPAPPESITAPPVGGLRLDRAAIAAIMLDTQEVAQMLADAMAAEGSIELASDAKSPAKSDASPELTAQPVNPASGGVALHLVPLRFRGICEALLTRGEWPTDEATKLASEHKVMLSGALEQLNDWAVEQYGAPVFIEEDGRVLVEKSHLC